MNKIPLRATTIVKLIYSLSELVIIMGRYIGIYAKDSLDELLLISHRGSSYKGKSREVERKAFSEWMDWIGDTSDDKSNIEMEDKELGYYDASNEEIENGVERSEDDMSKPNGDNFPYIRGHSNPY